MGDEATTQAYGSEGNRLFDAYLSTHKINNTEAGSALALTKSAVAHLRQRASPKTTTREAIEKYTNGAVPMSSWKTASDVEFLAQVIPFDASRPRARNAGRHPSSTNAA